MKRTHFFPQPPQKTILVLHDCLFCFPVVHWRSEVWFLLSTWFPLFWVMVHFLHFQGDFISFGKCIADLAQCLVLCFRQDKKQVGCSCKADGSKHEEAVILQTTLWTENTWDMVTACIKAKKSQKKINIRNGVTVQVGGMEQFLSKDSKCWHSLQVRSSQKRMNLQLFQHQWSNRLQAEVLGGTRLGLGAQGAGGSRASAAYTAWPSLALGQCWWR